MEYRVKIFLILIGLLILPNLADAAWYNSSWDYCQKITINNSQVVGTEASFAVLATTTDSNLKTSTNGGHTEKDAGEDIIFTNGTDCNSDGGSLLDFEREKYASTTGEIVYWIDTNISSTTDEYVLMYYGNAAASDQATTTGVWDDNFVGVWHLANDGVATTSMPDFLDSTGQDNDGSSVDMEGGVANLVSTSTIDGGVQFDGVDDYVDFDDIYNNISLPVTMSAWVYMPALATDGIFVSDDDATKYHGFEILTVDDGDLWVSYGDGSGSGDSARRSKRSNSTYSAGVWFHFVGIIRGATDMDIYHNGVDVGGTYSGTGDAMVHDVGNNAKIGRRTPSGNFWLTGIIDEVRISNTARSGDWITTEYNNQLDTTTFLTFGAEETETGAAAVEENKQDVIWFR